MVISGRGGSYCIASRMTVMQQGRAIAEIPDAGPWVLMDLPPGNHTLHGVFDGVTLSRSVQVAGKGTTVRWVLPSTLN